MATDRAISYQSGIRQFNANISKYTGMLGGLTPDIHTLRSLNPETTNRTICVMYRGPYFLMRYFGGKANTYRNTDFVTYKKMIEYYNTGITPNIGEGTLASANLQGGFAGRSIPIPTTQNTQSGQTLSISVPELVGRPMSNFHNMWVDGISDSITGLTTYHGLVAGSIDDQGIAQRIFKVEGGDELALEPSPAWEVAEFMLIALDRSGARVEGAIAALGCTPASKVGNQDLFTTNAQGASSIQNLQIVFNCQYVQSAYINDLASRYVNQFAVFGNSLNFNPGAGDAFWATSEDASGRINSDMFNKGLRPTRDAVQSGLGNAPVMEAKGNFTQRNTIGNHTIEGKDHFQYWQYGKETPGLTDGIDQYDTFESPFDADAMQSSGYATQGVVGRNASSGLAATAGVGLGGSV